MLICEASRKTDLQPVFLLGSQISTASLCTSQCPTSRCVQINIADGFYHLHLAPGNIPALGMAFPPAPDGTPLIAFPLTCSMGWVESPPWFSAATETETGADLANTLLATDYVPAAHRLDESVATSPATPEPEACTRAVSAHSGFRISASLPTCMTSWMMYGGLCEIFTTAPPACVNWSTHQLR